MSRRMNLIANVWFVLMLVLVVVFVTALAISTFSDIFARTIAQGERAGRIIMVDHTGTFCKIWRIQISAGQEGVMSQTWDFTIEDPTLVEVAQKAMRNKAEVIITFDKTILSRYCRSRDIGGDFVRSIVAVEP